MPGENRIIRVRGYVRFVKLSEDDCDIHAEIADWPKGNASRMIVEIPSRNQQARQQLLDIIGRVPPSDGLELRGAAAPRLEGHGLRLHGLVALTTFGDERPQSETRITETREVIRLPPWRCIRCGT
jgi:hypothetical protein